MFGYVRAAPDKLTAEEEQRYRALYCGLCHTLGRRYGAVSRMILNYDFTFLAALLSGAIKTEERRCVASPVKKRTVARENEALDLAADVSVILTYWKLRDGAADSGGLSRRGYGAVARLLGRAYREAARLHPDFDAATCRELERLATLEAERCPSLDKPADTFARLLGSVAGELPDPIQQRIMEQLLYHLGRWIYLVDALDDLKEDAESGNYNPILLRFSLDNGTLTGPAREAMVSTLDASIRQMAAAYELWDFGVWSPIIRSTVYQGLYCVGNAVLEGTFHTAEGRRGVRGKKEQV